MPDLTAAITRGRNALTPLLADTGTITRDPDQLDDATYNPTTMKAGRPTTDDTTVWTGQCLVVPAGLPEQQLAPGTPIAVGTYRALLPHDAPTIRRADVLTLSVSSDPLLVGKPLYVHGVEASSVNVARVLLCSVERPR